MKSLLVTEKESSWGESERFQAALQEKQVYSGVLEEEEEHTKLEERDEDGNIVVNNTE